MKTNPTFGIALGGGGSRAFIHLGVLAKLEEAGFAPGRVSGSSMGAVLGALYAAHPHAATAVPRIRDYFHKSSLFGGLIKQDKGDGLHNRSGWLGDFARKCATASVATAISFRQGLRRLHPVNRAIDELIGKDDLQFESLALPFGANALNLTSGELAEFTSGPLAPALKAGVAIGLVFAPFPWNGNQYADAAPISPVPVNLCRKLGADFVLAVDICAPLVRPLESKSGFDVVRRILSVQSEILHQREIAGADMTLRIEADDVFWGDFSRIDELIERGRNAANGIVGELNARFAAGIDT